MARLGNYIRQVRGVSYKPGDLFDSPSPDAITVLRANNITDDGEITLDDVVWVAKERVKDQQLIKAGDILVCASSGSKNLVGKAAQAEKDLDVAFGAFCKVVRPMNANKKYIGYFFQSPIYRRSISYASAGVNINNIRSEDLDALAIDLPDADEQAMRVNKLEKLARSIALRKKQLDKIDLLIKSQFIEMFEHRDIATIKIGSVLETTSGGTPSKSNMEYYENGEIPWMTSGEVSQGLIFDVKNRITEKGLKNSSAKWMPQDTVVVAMYGATAGQVGLLKIKTTTNQAVCGILPNGRFNALYLYHAVSRKKEWMISQCAGGAQPNISQTVIKRMEILEPPIDDQEQFAAFVEQTDKSKIPFELEVAA